MQRRTLRVVDVGPPLYSVGVGAGDGSVLSASAQLSVSVSVVSGCVGVACGVWLFVRYMRYAHTRF